MTASTGELTVRGCSATFPGAMTTVMRSIDVFSVTVSGVLWLVALSGASCDRNGEAPPDAGDSTPRKIVSDERPETPKRVVTMGPNVTETVFALGAGERVVGVSKFSDYPPEVGDLPEVGSFRNPNIEALLARKPDLVVGTISGGDADLDEKLDEAGIPYAFAEMGTVDEALQGMRWIGDWLGLSDEGKDLARRVERQLDGIASRYDDREAPRVLMVHGHEPIVAAGPGSLGHQLLVRAGGENALGDQAAEYPRLDVEKVMELDPERIVDTSTWSDQRQGDYWEQFEELGAVQSGGIRYLDDPVVLRAGPRLPEGLDKVARAIHGRADGAASDDAEGGEDRTEGERESDAGGSRR